MVKLFLHFEKKVKKYYFYANILKGNFGCES